MRRPMDGAPAHFPALSSVFAAAGAAFIARKRKKGSNHSASHAKRCLSHEKVCVLQPADAVFGAADLFLCGQEKGAML